MRYNFDEPIDRKGTYAAKIEAMPEGNLPDNLSVWVADMDFPCAAPILNALHKRVDRRIFGYTIYDTPALKNAVSGWFRRRYGWEVQHEEIVFSPGIVTAIALLIQALTEVGDGIIIQRPVYYPFTSKIEANGRQVVNSPLRYEYGHYTMDFADLDEKFSHPDVKGMILCSPHNPVGRVWTAAELQKLLAIARRYNKWIIADEIHMDLLRRDVTPTPLYTIAGDYVNQLMICTSPSKSFNLAGMQLSNLVIPDPDKRERFLAIARDQLSVTIPNPFGIEATIAAYNESEDWLEQVLDYLDGNFQYMYDFVEKELPRAKAVRSEGTYLAWLDLSDYGLAPTELERLMQTEAKIAFDEGYIFGEEGAGFERINLATPRSTVREVLTRMKRVLDALA